MKINVPLPFDRLDPPGEFTSMAAIRAIGAALDKAGFHAGLVTDHPCPTGRWLDTGGHHAQGPFVLLALLAAATEKLRLQTGILVLPYRNPFITARDVATLDHFSGGRVILSVGVGYLKGEYRALGVPFDARNALMDEYLAALRAGLSGAEFAFEGKNFTAFGNRILPGPAQPHLPIYIGGNSRRAIRRAVELGDGWNPFFTSGGGVDTTTTRTAALAGPEDLRGAIAYLRDYAGEIGRAAPEIVLGSVFAPGEERSVQKMQDRIGLYKELGVAAAGLAVEGGSVAEWCEDALRLGEEVIAKV